MALGSAGRFACVYIPSTFLYDIETEIRVHRARDRERERKWRERPREWSWRPHTHLTDTSTHGGSHLARRRHACAYSKRKHSISRVSFFEDTVSPSSKILCIRRYRVFEDTVFEEAARRQHISHQPGRESIGAVGWSGVRPAGGAIGALPWHPPPPNSLV